jgi:hypothetical protein
MDGSPSQGDPSLRKATDPYDPTIGNITLLVEGEVTWDFYERFYSTHFSSLNWTVCALLKEESTILSPTSQLASSLLDYSPYQAWKALEPPSSISVRIALIHFSP